MVLGMLIPMSGKCFIDNPLNILLLDCTHSVQFSSVQSLSRVRLFETPWIAARQASLSITNSRSSLRLTSIESVMPSNHLILCHPLLLLPPIPPSIRVFSNESTVLMRWPKYCAYIKCLITLLNELEVLSNLPCKEYYGFRRKCALLILRIHRIVSSQNYEKSTSW